MSLVQPITSEIYTPPRIPWDEFIEKWQWEQGQHVTIIAPTGAGKTTLMHQLFTKRDWNVLFAFKPRDSTYDSYLESGEWERATRWPPRKNQSPNGQNVILWPRIRTVDDIQEKAGVFKKCLESVFIDGGWTVGLDDLYYISEKMGFRRLIETLNYNVRALDVSLVSAMQRPAWVPRSCWDQSSHAFIGRMSNRDDIAQIRGLAGVSVKVLMEWQDELDDYEFLYLPVANNVHYQPCIVCPPES